ncbi:protein of unknown function DUF558 [Desulfobulbus propionicus DSM 2032]|uniref:Ribosomal RNA small subunit methyltransferase E n=1 Tax=Desulfobulbus propionicus (strain ATCC 33891 / DSM 2032 / VKM B-1956 / 1pr3) TaxID=577650 RepID=A0A7U3YQ17_DESPD|nr:RsmE family RNA methyltransferase [Desulfobulbus propionicus]ADW19472.1 protein of unknown function DUF558 [Desulfobulbus propionicus DSM 2032]
MRRFFFPHHAHSGDLIELSGAEARHIASVLRLKPGQAVELFDGQGQVCAAVLQTVGKHQVTARVTAIRNERPAVSVPLTLAQCLLKGKKMDLLVQKATELGAQAFMPVVSAYCENHGDRDHQRERWQRIMIEACKQCHRSNPMAILPVARLDQADFTPYDHRLAAWEGERQAALPTRFIDHPGPLCLFLGPEGGLHDDDLRLLTQWSFTPFSLGRHILRGETAALAALSIVQYLSGFLRPETANCAESSPPAEPSLFFEP